MFEIRQFQGPRPYMEDRAVIAEQFLDKYDVYAVFDGHGGDKVAEHCKERLLPLLGNAILSTEHNIPLALYETFVTLDGTLPKEVSQFVGSTANVLIKDQKTIWVANCGDSRAVSQVNDIAVPLSIDHKPHRKDEFERIKRTGGFVGKSVVEDVWRVNGILAVSRALGDHHLSPQVIPLPEIHIMDITPVTKFVIMATDGLWDVISNEDAVKMVFTEYQNESKTDRETLNIACTKLIMHAVEKGTTDNTTVMIVHIRR